METTEKATLYRMWGTDNIAYGPFALSTLIQRIQEERLTSHSWVFLEASNQWKQATELPELKPFFSSKMSGSSAPGIKDPPAKRSRGFDPAALRRFKLFANLEDRQLESFVYYFEMVRVPQFSHLVRQGQYGDAMYVVLEGELRALTIVEGKESILATMKTGDCIGEISLLDQGPRSADVIANKDSVLLTLSSSAFERLMREAPALAVPFLLALSREVVDRVRRTTKRYEDSIRFIRTSSVAR